MNLPRKINKKILVFSISLLLIASVIASGFGLMHKTAKEVSIKQPTSQRKNNIVNEKPDAITPKVKALDNQQGTPPDSSPPQFIVTTLNVHDPEFSYNNDKLGNPIKACRVQADITTSAAGTVKYYWDTYHPEYFNSSNKGPEESLEFEQAGTKNITLETYLSNNTRRFTLFILVPNNVSKPTATHVWCPSS